MKKITLSFITITLVVVFQMLTTKSMATNIDESTARRYSAYYLSVMSGGKEVDTSQVTLAYTFMNPDLNIPAAYIFNVASQGFVVVSGSDLWYPILGYSTEDLFDVNRMPPAFKWYFEGLCKYIIYSQNTDRALINDIDSEWKDLQNRTLPQSNSPKTSTWLLDSEWGQGSSYNPTYNKFCPYRDINGVRYTAITGCVATAMSQIINYWQYPSEPVEDTLRYPGCMIDDTVLFGDIAIDMKPVTYNFDTMPDELTSMSTTAEIDAIALLCYHVGVSVEMGYGINGSGAFSMNVPGALSNIFLYDTVASYETRVYYYVGGTQSINYTNDEWVSMLDAEIAANRPVYYSGSDMDANGNFTGGHAFVCDGHHETDSNKFHFNWGWNGYMNMWCDVRNNEIGDTNIYFGFGQDIVRYIKPRPAPTCVDPVIGTIDADYESAIITWTGGAVNYQILYKEASATTWSDTIVSVRHNCTLTNLLSETDYMVKIRALCHSGVGHSAWIDTTFSTTDYSCRIPTNVEVDVDGTSLKCDIRWNSMASRGIVNLFGSNFSYIDTFYSQNAGYLGLQENYVYSIAVKSLCDDTLASEWSDTVTFVVCEYPEVTNIETIMTYRESAFVAWEGHAVNYQLLYKDVSATTWSDTITTPYEFYNINDLVPGTNYMIKIRALYNSSIGYSEWSDTTFSTVAFICNVPTDVVATDVTYESVSIDWNSDGDATRWIVNVISNSQGDFDTVDHKPITLEGLTAGTEYSVAVKSLCYGEETSEWSDTISFATEACSEVTNLVVSDITTNSANVTWNSPDAVKWELNIGVGINQGEGEIVELDERYYAITGLQPNTTYDVYVRLYCTENSYGEWSEKVTFTTNPEEEPEGIDGVRSDFLFDIYPNPTSGSATIALTGVDGKVEISVVDINGRTIIDEGLECGSDCEKTLNVVNLSPGTYFVKVVGDRINSVRKLIVR